MKKILIVLLVLSFALPAMAQVGRYELRRSVRIASYQIFDTSTGEYTTVKWAPKEYDAEKIGGQVDTAVSKTIDKIKHLLRRLEESLEDLGPNKKDPPSDTINATV